MISCRKRIESLAVLLSVFSSVHAAAHPHVFAEARLDIVVDQRGTVQKLQHVWRFDDLFSSTVIFEFDMNSDLELDLAELQAVSDTIYDSLNEYNYFQMVTVNNKDVAMKRPDRLLAYMEDNLLIVMFEAFPQQTLPLRGKLVFGVYDPTFYTAIDFVEDDYLVVENLPPSCKTEIVRPDADEAIAENQATLTDAFFTDPTDLSKIFATRLELTCPD